MKPRSDDAPSLRGGYKPKNEALYVPEEFMTRCEDRELHQTVERYNLVNTYLKSIADAQLREFAAHLLSHLLPQNTNQLKLSELDRILEYVERGVKSVDSQDSGVEVKFD